MFVSNLVHHGWLEVYEDAPRHVLPTGGLGEESVETVVRLPDAGVRRHLSVRLDPVLQAVAGQAAKSEATNN